MVLGSGPYCNETRRLYPTADQPFSIEQPDGGDNQRGVEQQNDASFDGVVDRACLQQPRQLSADQADERECHQARELLCHPCFGNARRNKHGNAIPKKCE